MNMNPLIVNVRHAKGGFVYVGRAMHARGLAESPYANPFPITKTETRRKVLLDYIEHFIAQVSANNTDFRPEVLSRLAGKRLGCWCAPEPCHAELVSIAAELANEVLRGHRTPESFPDVLRTAFQRWARSNLSEA